MSSIVNKAKEILHKDKTHEAPEGTHGPHNSRVGNAADPRVDSDRDHRGAPTTGLHEGSYNRPAEGIHSSNYNTAEGTMPHSTYGSSGLGTTGTSGFGSTGTTGTTGTTGFSGSTGTSGLGGTSGMGSTYSGPGATTHSTTHGTTHGTSGGLTGSGAPEGTYGHHSSRVANAADPRIDSDRDNRGAHSTTHGAGLGSTMGTGTHTGAHTGAHTGTHGASYNTPIGSGPAPNTAGPHKSDMLNKADPRVDSNLDGSKTMGGNKTFQS